MICSKQDAFNDAARLPNRAHPDALAFYTRLAANPLVSAGARAECAAKAEALRGLPCT